MTNVNPRALILAALLVMVVIAVVVWSYRRIYATGWFVREATVLGWSPLPPAATNEAVLQWDWTWLAWFRDAFRSVTVTTAATIHTGDLETAFLLRMGRLGMSRGLGSAYPQRGVWIGIVGRLPRRIDASMLLLPYMGALGKKLIAFFSGREAIRIGDDVIDKTWMAYTDSPERAASAVADDPHLRSALVSLSPLGGSFADAIPESRSHGGSRLRHMQVMVEIAGDRFAILADAGHFLPGIRRLEHLERAARGFVMALGGPG